MYIRRYLLANQKSDFTAGVCNSEFQNLPDHFLYVAAPANFLLLFCAAMCIDASFAGYGSVWKAEQSSMIPTTWAA
jgi:hypothetical protein